MLFLRILRLGTLTLMAVSLAVISVRQDLLPSFWQVLRWLIPVWIVLLFAAQALVIGYPQRATPLDKLRNRLLGRRWRCPACGRPYYLDVPICEACAVVRPEPGVRPEPDEEG